MDANIPKYVHSDNAKYFTTAWRNTVYLHIDHQPNLPTKQTVYLARSHF